MLILFFYLFYSIFDIYIYRTIEDQKLIGCPVIIYDEKKYKNNRNEFRFNACFIIPMNADALKYEVAVKKLAKYLRTLEVYFKHSLLIKKKRKLIFM